MNDMLILTNDIYKYFLIHNISINNIAVGVIDKRSPYIRVGYSISFYYSDREMSLQEYVDKLNEE